MNDVARRSALAAIDRARPAIARLDQSRHFEELAADLMESWSAVETALRSLVGGTTLGGQALIREARQRQLLSFEQANALAEFHAASERAHATDYEPTGADLDSARDAFLKFESGLMSDSAGAAATAPIMLNTEGMRSSPLGPPEAVPPPRDGLEPWVKAVLAAIVVLLIAGLGYGAYSQGWFGGGRNDSLQSGIENYRRGQREAAVGDFTKAARDNPNDPLPHVYLSRMAREVGNMTIAGQEAQTAVSLGPQNATALRELGLYLLSAGNYDLSRRFLVRAVQADTGDRMAMGYLGCAMVRLGRPTEAQVWLNRAGQGDWSRCAAVQTPPMTPGQPSPGMAMPPAGTPRP
ncbi:MAG TPA: tetratricopeptide repeat protein [Gemmatimonadaceae bacterium]|nr:tetratricopeptide repeat protein [Gemmatimonadaceae bacterium]